MLAHEMLHAALRHGDRVGGARPVPVERRRRLRDQRLAGRDGGRATCPTGVLYDPALAGLSAEAVYDLIATDLRRLRKLATLRGRGPRRHARRAAAARRRRRARCDLDEFYRRALATGLAYHEQRRPRLAAVRAGRGDPGAGAAAAAVGRAAGALVRGVRAAARSRAAPTPGRPAARRPPRTSRARAGCARARRCRGARSASCSTPPARWTAGCSARRWARSPRTRRPATCRGPGWCSATPPPTTPGYLAVEEIAGRVKVRGRGGTVLQPGIRLLERADDFPTDAPDPGHHRRLVRRGAGPPRARLPGPRGRPAAVHPARPGLPHELSAC